MTTRRAIITGIGLTPALSMPAIAAICETSEERLIRLLHETAQAAQLVYPSIDDWHIVVGGLAGPSVMLFGFDTECNATNNPVLYRHRVRGAS